MPYAEPGKNLPLFTTKDMVDRLMVETPFTRKESRLIIDTIVGIMIDAMSTGHKVHILGLGTFMPIKRAPHGAISREDQLNYLYRVKYSPAVTLNKTVSANMKKS